MGNTGIEIDSDPVQCLIPPSSLQRFEGVAFSSSGNILGVVTADTNMVYLFRSTAGGRLEETPYWCIDGARSKLNYPHDISFAQSENTEILAVAQRGGAITIYEKHQTNDNFGPDPVFEIRGRNTKLNFTDEIG